MIDTLSIVTRASIFGMIRKAGSNRKSTTLKYMRKIKRLAIGP
jgi:hypothetical protein